jgi:hypothetical protein
MYLGFRVHATTHHPLPQASTTMNNNNNSMRRFIRVDPTRIDPVVCLRLHLGPDVDNLVIVIGFDRSSTRMPASFAPLPGHNAGDIVVRDRMRVLRNIDGSHHNADGVALSDPLVTTASLTPLPAGEIVVRDRMRVDPAAVPTDGVLVPDHNVGEIVHRDNNLDEDPQQILGKMIVLTLIFVVERRPESSTTVLSSGIW